MSEPYRIIYYPILIVLLLALACSEEVTPPTDNFVVEAFINANDIVDNIKIKKTSPIGSDTIITESIDNARVILSNETNGFPLVFNASTGLYFYDDNDLNIEIGQTFNLEVQVGDRVATSSTIVPRQPQGLRLSKPELVIPNLRFQLGLREQITDLFFSERIRLNWDAVPGERYFVVIESRENIVDPILPELIPEEPRALLRSFRFISEPSENATFEIIGVALETYGTHIAKVFTVNKEYADLFDSVEQDSRDLNEPASNIDNALGIFTAFSSDSIFFEIVRN